MLILRRLSDAAPFIQRVMPSGIDVPDARCTSVGSVGYQFKPSSLQSCVGFTTHYKMIPDMPWCSIKAKFLMGGSTIQFHANHQKMDQ